MTPAAVIPLLALSMVPRPADWLLMAALTLKAYLDDSGDSSLPAVAISGFVGNDRCWEKFEPAWQAALDKNEIPYFHFNEICDPSSHMHKFYGKPGAEALKVLLTDLAAVISKCAIPGIHHVGSLVPTKALVRFNKERGHSIDAISFALFNCIHMMQHRYPEYTIEALLDQITGAETKIALAKEYLATFPHAEGKDFVSVIPAKNNINTKTVRGLQAADFAAYEVYRVHERIDPFLQTLDLTIDRTPAEWAYDHDDWLEKTGKTSPNRRQSLMAIGNAVSDVDAVIWTYESLCAHDDLRGGRWHR